MTDEKTATPSVYRRVYVDIAMSTDELLTERARAAKCSKKAYLERLILADAVPAVIKARKGKK